jgi:glycerol-3-phosphate dehydrogenase (NAD(P)+)
MNNKFAVLGGGSWGTAIVKMLLENNRVVNWYVRTEEDVQFIKNKGRNSKYLQSVVFDKSKINPSSSIRETVTNSEIIILAIPSPFLDTELKKIGDLIIGKTIFSALKGVIPESHLIVSEHLNEFYKVPFSKIGIITGPCHAEEVALEKLSYLTVACKNEKNGREMANSLMSSYINVKFSKDTMGVEYAAMLKNVYAIVAGICHGLGYGDNFQSVLISNCVREMKKFVYKIYKTNRDINDSEYLGDLLVTCYSSFSRNRTLGNMIGKGYTLKAAISEMSMISEGYYATKNAYELIESEFNEFDIISSAYQVLYKNSNPKTTIKKLTELLD